MVLPDPRALSNSQDPGHSAKTEIRRLSLHGDSNLLCLKSESFLLARAVEAEVADFLDKNADLSVITSRSGK
ncbi:MAG: hypothetical protein JWQ17_788 [Tardiphaga sp.]|nr:hypothetical protein [Tardiphaga sp.]